MLEAEPHVLFWFVISHPQGHVTRSAGAPLVPWCPPGLFHSHLRVDLGWGVGWDLGGGQVDLGWAGHGSQLRVWVDLGARVDLGWGAGMGQAAGAEAAWTVECGGEDERGECSGPRVMTTFLRGMLFQACFFLKQIAVQLTGRSVY